MIHRRMLLVVVVGALTLVMGAGTAAGQSAPDCSQISYAGDGTEQNPYEVGNVSQLQCINEQDTYANYTQTSDIDASGTSVWNNGSGFHPIGDPSSGFFPPFNGSFEGNGYNITGLAIDRYSEGVGQGETHVGLFGFVGTGGEVTEVSVLEANISGTSAVGGLVGANNGTVTESYVTGSINGSDFVGGLVGSNGGMVSKTYATSSVYGSNYVGGLVGGNGGVENNAVIEESYAAGLVTYDSFSVGGLVGYGYNNSTVNDSYWDVEATGQSSSEGGTGLNTSEMVGNAAVGNMTGFDFTNTWQTVTNPDDYPVLAWQTNGSSSDRAPDCSAVSYNGNGTQQNPYEVSNVDQLQCINSQGLSANYIQTSDIDASGTSAWNNGSGFEPIGNFSTQFNGTFNGSHLIINGLYINRSRSNLNSTGLFGITDSGALLKNVGVENVSVNNPSTGSVGGLVGFNDEGVVNDSYATGEVYASGIQVGGLVGENRGTVNSSYSTANVSSGSSSVGGLIGENLDGKVLASYATGRVSGSGDRVGGLIGNNHGTVRDSHATGTVSGPESLVGGLVGGNIGTVESSYATGKVNGTKSGTVGGLVGSNFEGMVLDSYSTGNVSGNRQVGGLAGENRGIVNSSYATGDVSGSGFGVGGLVGVNIDRGEVSDSYATGNVSGSRFSVGGLVGTNDNGTVNSSYAIGSVSGNALVGGLVGSNSGTVTDSYWDVNTTGQTASAGSPNASGLITDEMTGSAAESNMTGFDFTSTWETVTNPDDYPILAWQTGDEPTPAFFEVTIDSTNSPVTEGENLTVTATVTNTGGEQDTQTVTGRLSGLAPPVSTPITLGAGNSTTKTRTVVTEAGDAGSYTVNVSSEDDLALATVNVTRDSRGNFTEPLPVPGFAGPPQNIPVSQGGFNDSLVEDLDGDGNPTDIGPTVSVFGELIRGNDLGLTDEQARKLNWNSGSPADKVTVADMVTLFGKQIRAE
jgi:hypothetical protein